MKPGFALSLSFDGIALLHRAAGGWRLVGEVSLEVNDLRAALADLRAKALRLSPSGVSCKVILPNDQIRYLSVETGSFSGDAVHEIVRGALENATPYSIADIAYDVSPEGGVTHVAAVARETLAEAEAFALEHDFAPVSFVAIPGDQPFLGEPWFGTATGFEKGTGGKKIEPDGIAVVVIGPAEIPEPIAPPPPARVAEPPAPKPAGFASRRRGSPEPTGAEEGAPPTPVVTERPRITLTPDRARAELTEPEQNSLAQDVEDPQEQDHAATPDYASVTAPVLDIPVLDSAEAAGEVPVEQDTPEEAASFGSFLSRRRRREKPEPEANRPPLRKPEAIAIALPERQIPKDEAGRMTVFGARGASEVGGKPKHLGLMLTAALLAFLAIVAVWASIFLDEGVAGLFGFGPDDTELAQQAPVPVAVTAPTPSVQDTDPVAMAVAPQPLSAIETLAPPRHLPAPVAIVEAPASPALTDTDKAVLDALRLDPEAGEPDPEALADGGEDFAAMPEGQTDPEAEFDNQADQPMTDGVARYAATGIWPNSPDEPEPPAIIGLDDVFIASIDRTDLAQDALALPPVDGFDTDAPPAIVSSPAAAGTDFALDQRGLVAPSPEGTMNPDGIVVFSGPPPHHPRTIPVRFETTPDTESIQQQLSIKRPRARPNDLAEKSERSQLGGLTREELATVRPRLRPSSVQETAEQAAPDQTPEASLDSASAQAVSASKRPDLRPAAFASLARTTPPASSDDNAPSAAIAPATVQPSIPSTASVARQATLKNAINLRNVNLIGVYGTPSNRRALVRLPSGRYKKVQVGDSVDGGRIVAIGDNELRYQKGGRNLTLKIPSG